MDASEVMSDEAILEYVTGPAGTADEPEGQEEETTVSPDPLYQTLRHMSAFLFF